MAPIVRAVQGEPDAGDLVQRRWSWPGQNGKPVYNFRSEGREFAVRRCLIPADGFYEFTDPADKKKKRKDKWLFTKTGEPWFCIAGIWRTDKGVGEAFTMLTMPPGPDIAPYHDRQIAILDRADWAAWLDCSVSAKAILKPLPAGASPSNRWVKPSVARLCVGAHQQKNEPAGGSCSYDGHDTFLNPLGCIVNVAFLHIRSAILKTSQPEGGEADAPEKHARDHRLLLLLFTGRLRRYWRLRQVTNC